MRGDEQDDTALLAASATGDADAFAVLVRRHIRSATLLAAQLMGDRDDAEDVVQEAFTIVYGRADRFEAGRDFGPWLFGIVRKLAANRRAREARRGRLLRLWRGEPVFRDNSVEASAGSGLDLETLQIAMNVLSPMQRACFELVALRGIPTEEAAAMHGISESTVRQHIFRARRALAEALDGAAASDETARGGDQK